MDVEMTKTVRPKKQKDKDWQDLQDYITNAGAKKYIQVLKASEDAEFVRHYTKLIEFFKPKLQKIDNELKLSDAVSINFKPAEKKLRKVG